MFPKTVYSERHRISIYLPVRMNASLRFVKKKNQKKGTPFPLLFPEFSISGIGYSLSWVYYIKEDLRSMKWPWP